MLLLSEIGPLGLRDRLRSANDGHEVVGLASQVRVGANLSRKAAFDARLRVENNEHVDILRAYVARFFSEPDIRNEVLKHVDSSRNLQRRATNAIAIAYNVPPRRTLRGVPDDQQRVFADAYRELRIDTEAETWNRLAFACSVVHVIPRLVAGEIELMTVLPHAADVLFDKGERKPSILAFSCESKGGVVLCAVDSERFWWLDKDFKVVADELHGMGRRPWVTWRFEDAKHADYWNVGSGQALYDATLKLARVAAHYSWVRLGNAKKMTHIHLGQNVEAPESQSLQTNAPVVTRGDGASAINVHDTIVSPDTFLAEMREIAETALEEYGLPVTTVDFSQRSNDDAPNAYGPAGVRQHDALAKVRAKQVKQFEHSEQELATRIAVLLRKLGRFNVDEKTVRSAFRVQFAPLSFADTPKAKIEAAMLQIELGQTNVYEVYQADNPGMTEDEAREAVLHNVEVRAEHLKHLIEHNVSIDPAADGKTVAQLNGMIGGVKSGESRSQGDHSDNVEMPR